MDRREMLGVFGTAVAGALTVGAFEARAADESDHHHHHMDKVHEDCLKACGDCAKECNMMAHHCLDKICKGEGVAAVHAKANSLAIDCQDFCVLSAAMIARSSDMMAFACAACADACKSCAEECEKAKDDAAMAECAKKCRACEKTCRAMVSHMKLAAG